MPLPALSSARVVASALYRLHSIRGGRGKRSQLFEELRSPGRHPGHEVIQAFLAAQEDRWIGNDSVPSVEMFRDFSFSQLAFLHDSFPKRFKQYSSGRFPGFLKVIYDLRSAVLSVTVQQNTLDRTLFRLGPCPTSEELVDFVKHACFWTDRNWILPNDHLPKLLEREPVIELETLLHTGLQLRQD